MWSRIKIYKREGGLTMHIYYEAKALERAIDAAPRITPSTKSVLKKIIRSVRREDGFGGD